MSFCAHTMHRDEKVGTAGYRVVFARSSVVLGPAGRRATVAIVLYTSLRIRNGVGVIL